MPSKGSVRLGVSAPAHEKKKARISKRKPATIVKPVASRRPATPPPNAATKPEAHDEPVSLTAGPSTPQPCNSFTVIAGSYEKLLYGLEGTFPPDGSASTSTIPVPTLKPVFIFPAHIGSVRAVAASPDGGKWLATGSTDEIIKVWNLKRRKEVGGLVQHEGSITYLNFPTRNTLVSASEDGTIALFRVRGWELLRSLKGHTGRVNSVAVHPSGKVALSVGKDRTLRMWDLIRGKGAASVKLGKEGEVARWSEDGTRFVVQAGKEVDVYGTDMSLRSTIAHPSRVHDVRFCARVTGKGEVLLVTAEDGKVAVYELLEGGEGKAAVIAELTGHKNRVKGVDTIRIALPTTDGEPATTTYAVTASSDGFINLYDLSGLPLSDIPDASKPPVQLSPVTSYDTKGTRLTCVAFAEGEVDGADKAPGTNGKRKRDEDETDVDEASEKEEEEEEEEEEELGSEQKDQEEDA